jgi:hypothetical protein
MSEILGLVVLATILSCVSFVVKQVLHHKVATEQALRLAGLEQEAKACQDEANALFSASLIRDLSSEESERVCSLLDKETALRAELAGIQT